MPRDDYHTNTVGDASAHEAMYADQDYPDFDYDDALPPRNPRPPCTCDGANCVPCAFTRAMKRATTW